MYVSLECTSDYRIGWYIEKNTETSGFEEVYIFVLDNPAVASATDHRFVSHGSRYIVTRMQLTSNTRHRPFAEILPFAARVKRYLQQK